MSEGSGLMNIQRDYFVINISTLNVHLLNMH